MAALELALARNSVQVRIPAPVQQQAELVRLVAPKADRRRSVVQTGNPLAADSIGGQRRYLDQPR